MTQPNDPTIFPELEILRSPVDIVCGCLGRIANALPTMLPSSTDPVQNRNRGASVTLDEALDIPEDFGF